MHHLRVRGNYAGYLVWTDRVFGTLSKGYAEDLAALHRQVEILVNDPAPELRAQAPDLNGRGFGVVPEGLGRRHRSNSM